MNKNIKFACEHLKEIVYQAANIENKNITIEDVIQIFDSTKRADIPIEKRKIIVSLIDAYNYVIDKANSGDSISYKDALKINELVDSYERSDAGCFRNTKVWITGCSYIPKIHTEQESINMLNKWNNIKTFEDGIRYCAYWSKMQIFSNGNKRTSICFANLCLLSKDIKPILISNRYEYLNRLADYYDTESKIENLISYVIVCFK